MKDKNLFDQEKIKAVLEAMVFVSPEPVTVRQMLTKIKQVLKKDEESFLLNEVLEDSVIEDAVIETLIEENSQDCDEQKNVDTESQAEHVLQNEDNESYEDQQQEAAEDYQESTEDDYAIDHRDIKVWLKEISEKFAEESHGFELIQVAKGYQFRTKYEVSLHLRAEKKSLPSRLSASAMETLAIVAYEQPVARSKVDDVRGVDSGGVLRTLLEKEFIRIVGRADEPGQPLLYGTTQKFLEVFNLKNLKDLPSLSEMKELEEEDSDDEVSYYDGEDVIEQRMNELSEEEAELMQELDESLSQLKDSEKKIEMFQQKKEAESDPVQNQVNGDEQAQTAPAQS